MWVKVEDTAPIHPKMFRVGVAAYGWWQAALCYCMRYLTDGVIPAKNLAFVFPGTPPDDVLAIVEQLTAEGLLEVRDETSYTMHDYLEHQNSRLQVLQLRDERAKAGRKGGKVSAKLRTSAAQALAQAHAGANAKALAGPRVEKSRVEKSRVQPVVSGSSSTPLELEPVAVDTASPRGEEPNGHHANTTALNPERLIDLFNDLMPDETPAVFTRSPERLRKAKQYLARFPDEAWWRGVFTQVHRSEFLRGLRKATAGHESFVADFDWLLSKGKDGTENCVKVADGRYSQ